MLWFMVYYSLSVSQSNALSNVIIQIYQQKYTQDSCVSSSAFSPSSIMLLQRTVLGSWTETLHHPLFSTRQANIQQLHPLQSRAFLEKALKVRKPEGEATESSVEIYLLRIRPLNVVFAFIQKCKLAFSEHNTEMFP